MTRVRSWSYWLCAIAALAAFAIIALLPVGAVLFRSLWNDHGFSLDVYRAVLTEGRQWDLLANSLTIAAGTTLLATLLGASVGFLIEYHRVPGRALLGPCIAAAFLIPPQIAAIAWIDLLGRNGFLARAVKHMLGASVSFPNVYTVGGVVLVLTLCCYPIVVLTTVVWLRRFDERLEEAGRLTSSDKRVFRAIMLPIVAPGILTGALFVFVLCLIELGVPSLLQVNTYPVELYASSAYADFPAATAQSLPLVACGCLALAVWVLYIRPRQAWLTGAARQHRPRRGRRSVRVLGASCCWSVAIVSTVLPVAVLVYRTLPLRSFVEVWQTAKEEIATSFVVAAVSATVLVALALPLAYFSRGRAWLSRFCALSLIPFMISGPMIGMGLIGLWNRPGPMGLVYDSLLIIVLACVARFIFFAHQGLAGAFRDLHPRLEEAAVVAGAPWWRQLTEVFIPLLRPTLVALWGLAFIFSFRELDAAVLVTPPGRTPLSVRLFTLMHYGPSRLVAALSVLTVAVILASGVGTMVLYTRWRRLLVERN